MKAWLIYWVIGCFIVGIPMGQIVRECPDYNIHSIDVIATVVAWPTILIAVIGGSGPIKRTNRCPAQVAAFGTAG